jgi:hypothetical protein
MSSPGLSAFDDMLSPQMDSAYKELEAQNKLRAAALEKVYYAPQRAMWDKITKDLTARQAGPSASERLYAVGAALMQPTPYRGIAGALANVSPVLAEQQKAVRAAEDAKRDLLLKYGMETGKLGLEQKKTEIDDRRELAQARYKALMDQYRIANTPHFVPGPYGGGTYVYPSVQTQAGPQSFPSHEAAAAAGARRYTLTTDVPVSGRGQPIYEGE